MKIKISTITFLLFISCTKAPLHVTREKHFTDTWWGGLSTRIVSTPTLVTDGKQLYFGTQRGTLYALSGKTGGVIWEKELSGSIEALPLISEKSIFVGTSEGKISAISKQDGKIQWTQVVSGEILGQPILYNNETLLFGANDGFLYALNASNGEQRWRFKKDLPDRITIQGFATPAILEQKIFVAFADGTMSGLRLNDGTEIWSQKLPNTTRFGDVVSPLVNEGKELLVAQYGGSVLGIDTAGKILWTVNDAGSSASIVTQKGIAYMLGASNQIIAVKTASGEPIWTQKLGESATWSGAALYKGRLLAGTFEGFLYVIDPNTGNVLWKYDVGASIQGAPQVIDQNVWVLTRKGKLFRFNAS